ncbi:prostaglandin G/H synthase 2/cyclooxygenase 2, pgh2/cox2 [Zopfia rhizophila CBS 207.26]|uniref:linoleate 8R-lipoxygenase n=1 Tax=Zopfia rhizophila CBS 207.26 TaxID=1314779 RepID=A0A6A6DEH2_9PEZI|nr:prostaglandin G/H synthase 2/cyclooxygenase 2, pgh2/cox2 [Zopfia rhizophila CBS 207.26]
MTDRYQAGEAYADDVALTTGLLEDLQAVGIGGVTKDVQTLMDVFKTKGKAIDDKEMTMEKLIAIAASLPNTSRARAKLTHTIIDTLWGNLQHPPLSYMGDNFMYRTPDGSYNNVLNPSLGAAGTPYAKTCRSAKKLQGVKPDPGLLFDLLMSREKGHFQENPAGLSSVLFYHATIIIHDIFRTSRKDHNISDVSSYLDLAPLYGSSFEDQMKVRTMERGLLKPDTFHEKRLLGQPPGVNVILVMYSRFHNYVAEMLLKINEEGRFSLAPYDDANEEEKIAALRKQDNDLFQTARLIVGGLYVNISLHDYLRGLTNTHHSKSDWTLDPRAEINKQFDGEGVPRGIGNQVSAEFNLLYRFHSVISLRDEKWLEKFFRGVFPNLEKPLEQITPVELWQGLARYEASIPQDPSKREFGGITRGHDGKFKDADLAEIMQKSIDDPAGLFGARMVPKALRVVEILGILQSRKWKLASLNEFRDFFGLKRHTTMEDINPDPEIANLLGKLYNHPDMVELYPGLFLEEGKPRMDPGCGGCPPYTVGRAIFSDAVTLVRSDRFYTLDYTPATLTNWGMQEVQQDYKTLGGSMFYKLIQRALPGWFPYNSLHVMQPMFTKKMNEIIARKTGTIHLYTLDDPSPPQRPIVVAKHSAACKVLNDQASFKVPWAKGLNELFPGKKEFSSFMLGADFAVNTAQRNLVEDTVYGFKELRKDLADFVANYGSECLKAETLNMAKDLDQVDIIRDVAIPVNTRMIADIFSLDLKTAENPDGSLSISQLYKALVDVRTWGFNNNDPAMAWNRRRWAQDSATLLSNSTDVVVNNISKDGRARRPLQSLTGSAQGRRNMTNERSLRWYGRHIVSKLLAAGKSPQEISEICWLTAVAGVGVVVGVFSDVLSFFLQPEHRRLWAEIQDFTAAQNPESDGAIREYVLEAQRLTSQQRDMRVCAKEATLDGIAFNKGDAAIILLGDAVRDPEAIPNPSEFTPGRPANAYMSFGFGPHECLGRELSVSYCTSLIKLVAGLKLLRPAPGEMGTLKQIMVGTERCYLNDNWSYLTFDPTTWKLHFSGYGKGVATEEPPFMATQEELDSALYRL